MSLSVRTKTSSVPVQAKSKRWATSKEGLVYIRYSGKAKWYLTGRWSSATRGGFIYSFPRLDAYYVFIHIYFPILPPPTTPPVDQLLHDPYSPSPDRHAVALSDSPLVLAILALLSLIPHPLDSDPLSYTSTLARRARAQKMADAAFRLVDDEEDIAESENEPAKALSEGHLVRSRKAFHPLVPQALEAIIALDLLSVYEYAQRGNLKKMQSRSGQALMACMSQGLNTCSLEDDFTEARRRVWWMTYISVIQAAVVNNQSSSPSMIDPSHSVPLPTLASDTQVFHIFLQAQRAIYKATEFVTSQNKAAREQVQTFKLTQDMMDLDAHLSLLVQQCESLASQAGSTLCLTPDEAVVAWSLSARIKLHRYRAFQDVPIFPVRHCDLTKTEDSDSPSNGNDSAHGCCGLTGYEPIEAISTSVPWVRHDSVLSHPRSEHHLQIPGNHESAKMCLRSALAIASAFDDLPYPNPTGATDPSSPTCFLSSHSDDICPRTMPSFACCAMQCAYVLLMTHRKTKQLYPHAVAKWNRSAESRTIVDDVTASQANKAIVTGNPSLDELLRKLSIGFYSISWTLSNYASTCEAIGGMRGESWLLYVVATAVC
ncbi:Hypothetical protein D9617_7g030750 [Elsinoe fawcettii]|nr:Hypothetical protein D9617_7g030750 [Elsinoe fawcettii]